jgi:hypothetical protein
MGPDTFRGLVRFCGRDRRAVRICHGLIIRGREEQHEIKRLDPLTITNGPEQALEQLRGHVSRELVNQLVQPAQVGACRGHVRSPFPLCGLPERPHPFLHKVR